MPTARKVQVTEKLEELIGRSTVAISANYRGMTVAEMTALRRRMREAGVEMHVVKNSLLRRAAEQGGKPEIAQIVEGPTALVFGFAEPNAPAGALTEYVRTARTALTLNGAYFDGQVLPASGVAELASLPSRPQLISQFMGGMQSPIAMLAGLLSGTLREFAGLIEARSSQMESGTA
jgi:large subunit ribosomal protein L10